MTRFQIGNKWLGPNEQTYFIADIAANHDGDLNRAKLLIELCKEAGADAAKFQNFQAPKIVSKRGFENLGGQMAHQAQWKKSVYDVYKSAEINKEWTETLKNHCDKVGITYFTSPYDVESIELVDPFVPAYKIGSGDITFTDILVHIAKKKKPLFLATGASTLTDVVQAMTTLKENAGKETPICIMQCNTNYTGNIENFKYVQLNVLKTYSLLFPEALLGLSDHTPGHTTVLGAVTLGARVIEKHFTDDNNREGPDHKFSMNPQSWREMVVRTRELEYALGTPTKKIEDNEKDSAIVQRRSLFVAKPLKLGEKITGDHVEALRPAPQKSIAPTHKNEIVGRHAPKDYQVGDCLLWTDW